MKKRLFLLPLVGGFLLSGCTFELFGKPITINFPWEKAENQEGEGGGGSGGGSGEGGGGSGGGSGEGGGSGTHTPEGGGEKGTGLSTVNMYGWADIYDSQAAPVEFTNKGCKVSIAKGSSSSKLEDAVNGSKQYEFRIYKGFDVTFSADTDFSKLEILYSTYKSGSSTYYFDFQNLEGATNEYDNAAETEFQNTGKATVTLNSAAKEFKISNIGHQTRVRSVKFIA